MIYLIATTAISVKDQAALKTAILVYESEKKVKKLKELRSLYDLI